MLYFLNGTTLFGETRFRLLWMGCLNVQGMERDILDEAGYIVSSVLIEIANRVVRC